MTWEPDFSQTCNFRRILMNHKNFHFAQIPDKTNDVIFLKSLKPCFWAIFDHFFQKNPAPSHITRYGPLTPCQVSEKTNEPILRKLTNRRKDRQTNGLYFIRLFRLRPGVQQEELDNADLQGTILMDLSKAHGCIPLHTYK